MGVNQRSNFLKMPYSHIATNVVNTGLEQKMQQVFYFSQNYRYFNPRPPEQFSVTGHPFATTIYIYIYIYIYIAMTLLFLLILK